MNKLRIITGTALFCLTAAAAGAAGLTPGEQLGKSIFFDSNLSANGNQSCASCHSPSAGWTGADSAVNAGTVVYEGSIPNRFGNRKPPSSAYATASPLFHYDSKAKLFIGGNFWDGRATGERLGSPSAEQALGPFLNQLEQALAVPADVIGKVCSSSYTTLFTEVCGPDACDPTHTSATYDCIGRSIAAYEASGESNAYSSKFDAFLKGKARLSVSELKGFGIFMGKGQCNKCHVATMGKKKGPPLFSDNTFDNLGIPRNPANPFYYADPAFNPDGLDWVDPGLGGFLATRTDYQKFAEANMGKHRVPTLRNVDKRPDAAFVKAYGHNGYFKSLKEIVHFYNTRDILPACMPGDPGEKVTCWPAPEEPRNINTTELGNLGLSDAEENALVDFMKTLSDGYTK